MSKTAQPDDPSPQYPTCGICVEAIYVGNDSNYVICVAHLEMRPADHAGGCSFYRPTPAKPVGSAAISARQAPHHNPAHG